MFLLLATWANEENLKKKYHMNHICHHMEIFTLMIRLSCWMESDSGLVRMCGAHALTSPAVREGADWPKD